MFGDAAGAGVGVIAMVDVHHSGLVTAARQRYTNMGYSVQDRNLHKTSQKPMSQFFVNIWA